MSKIAFHALFVLAVLPSAASAEAVKLDGKQIAKALSEHVLVSAKAGDTATQLFKANGATFYSSGTAQQQGAWRIKGDQYCSIWPPNETPACYDVYVNGNAIRFVSASGSSSDWLVKGP